MPRGVVGALLALVLLPRFAAAEERVVRVAGAGGVREYRVGKRLGAGASGAVHLGHDLQTGREVAIKLMHHAGGADTFDREHQVLDALGAKSGLFARSLGVGHTDDAAPVRAFVMERLHGSSIGQQEGTLIRMAPMPADKAVPAIRRVIDGLRDLHALGLSHNDVHGANILADAEHSAGSTRLLDVGNVVPLTAENRRNDLRQSVEVLARMITGTDSAHWPPEAPLDQIVSGAQGRVRTLGDVLRRARTVGYATAEELEGDLALFASLSPHGPPPPNGALVTDPTKPEVYLIEGGRRRHVAGPQFMSPAAWRRLQRVAPGALDGIPDGPPFSARIP